MFKEVVNKCRRLAVFKFWQYLPTGIMGRNQKNNKKKLKNKTMDDIVELQWLEHRWLVYHGCFELVLESLGKNPLAADLG